MSKLCSFRNCLLSFLFLLECTVRVCSQTAFNVEKIDHSLVQNANAIIRIDEEHFEIISKDEAIRNFHFAVTILSEKGENIYNQVKKNMI